MMLVVLLSFLFDASLVISRGWLIISWVALLLFVGLFRFMFRRLVYRLRRSGVFSHGVVIVGSGGETLALANWLRATPESGLHVTSCFDPAQNASMAAGDGEPDEPTLTRLIARTGASDVIVNAASVSQAQLAGIVRDISNTPVQLHIVPGMYEIITTGVTVRDVRGLPLVTMNKVRITGFDHLLKRTLDVAVSLVVLLAFTPLLFGIAVAIRLTSPGPILHRRQVVGQGGTRFHALKFRSMRIDGDELLKQCPELARQLEREGKLLDDPRVTTVGAWLRRWSLDELPQLINVLRGQMSLVGPRMISDSELQHFGPWQDNLCTVQPGLTGLWQISGRSQLGYIDRVKLDMHYIRTYSIWTDIDILIRTVPAVIRGVGAY
jgi:exopolysaccharide biosynthesis polyprenyl glycosylphosphotransferase